VPRQGRHGGGGPPHRPGDAPRLPTPRDRTAPHRHRLARRGRSGQLRARPRLHLAAGAAEDLRPGSTVDRYELYGAAPGTAAFELFTREVVGRADAIHSDWTPAEDAAATEARLARGGRGLAFVNREVLHPLDSGVEWVAVDAGDGCVRPSVSAVRAGLYPLTDPLYLYVSRSALDELRVRSLARFAVVEYGQLIPTVRTIVPADPRAVERSARELPPAPIPEG
jgi:hypothetical protein